MAWKMNNNNGWANCQATYVSETRRNLIMRLNEHTQATKKGDLNNNMAEHHSEDGLTPQFVKMSVTNNSPSQDSNHPDDLFQSR